MKQNLKIKDILQCTKGELIQGNKEEECKNYSKDTRTIQEGDIPDGIVYDEFCVSPLFDDYLKKLINLCEDKDIQVRIVKLPLPGKEKYTQEYTEGFHSYYKAIKKSFPGITVDWFSAYEEDKFVDSSHMNSHGALKFSKELKMLYSEDF